jgi:hypothetical protein
MPFTISQPNTATVTIGTNATNKAWIYSDAAGTVPISTTPINATGTGASQTISAYVGLSGSVISAAIAGLGAITGSVQYVLTF